MSAVIFDLDDTLYDQLEPFKRAVQKDLLFPEAQIEDLYLFSRRFSDEVFHLTHTGKMKVEDMHIYRMQNACAQFGMNLTLEQALRFQEDYAYFQGQIELFEDAKETLSYCQQYNIPVGLITNGPTDHQWAKVQQLGLVNWIAEENIFISSAIGFSKPDIKLFEYAEQAMGLDKRDTYYIGDSYENDINGAKNAGWKAIWRNHRGRKKPQSKFLFDQVIEPNHTLSEIISVL
ncbi:HAD family hydrolase [Tetragenococcus koreensis]|uniref:HAD family hydrolase n=1 Tax=Tetragenococcus koreensis TaxID=290335 RepID=A0AAN4RJ65_9ENTE|nr:HAD family hydrolase [Tetragenococcus koreensis]MCF1585033.1 HAD family hydrolase [Tetragenococcus koreensis]MCF1614596.1 HAD family hydrolase [Tetragenococcus koreensis]MCF1619420.1 HAD family hydrolase [Tetragenococcus koreensis]MCF1624379.1 HAD family hydrolase [Tetragenococcus koreensis]MCF1627282.1 HAD family hydrolase [Tetragenococcus koreensis]